MREVRESLREASRELRRYHRERRDAEDDEPSGVTLY